MKKTQLLTLLLAAAAALFTVAACGGSDGDDNSKIRFGGDGEGGTGSGPTSKAAVAKRIEVPALKSGNTFVSHWTKEGGDSVMNYCLEFDPTVNHSRWVAFRFDGITKARVVARSDEPWSDDPSLPTAQRVGTGNYQPGFDRGHLCASNDRIYSRAANEQTFYMSNISPQLSSFNQGYWITLEMHVQNLARRDGFCDTLYVVKGGTIDAAHRYKDASGKDFYKTRNNGLRVVVPGYYYMALLKVKNGAYSAIGFLLEHKEYGYTNKNQAPISLIAQQALSIDDLEAFTGIDFFPNLPDKVEEVVEASYFPSAWGI